MKPILAQLLLAVIEFFLINWLGRHSVAAGYYTPGVIQDFEDKPLFNVVFRVLAPVIFLVLTATLWFFLGFEELVTSYWRVTLFYFVIRWGFNVALGRASLLRWGNQLLIGAISTLLSFYTYHQFLQNRYAVLPSARSLADELWLIIILFIYSTYNHLEVARIHAASEGRRDKYILAQFARSKKHYGKIVTETAASPLIEALGYAVMIYEGFNRPAMYQWIERRILFPLGRSRSLGPMQVQVSEAIDDEASVRRGIQKLAADYRAAAQVIAVTATTGNKPGVSDSGLPAAVSLDSFRTVSPHLRWELLERTLSSYNVRSDYGDAVLGIFRLLIAKQFPEVDRAIYDYSTFERQLSAPTVPSAGTSHD